ncbi:hypothetical protein BAUCODRAFT_33017 [Baudoinia panamericana UAMH 10762]|uniref:Uncharacterized protein n=1 Tax=Baudoinia panamericana (strain UAMH 10762) TaxID=717646 RepID=M2MKR6_BAUPA|nr:uncharacterized protein BAUCODRAFT_33017 [Baudoinia panamericana UAMH 10762]EMC97286.1 hypothetical protein BAUCODRAFT_33017 [Baudoinia panamericana UAMH 10762]
MNYTFAMINYTSSLIESAASAHYEVVQTSRVTQTVLWISPATSFVVQTIPVTSTPNPTASAWNIQRARPSTLTEAQAATIGAATMLILALVMFGVWLLLARRARRGRYRSVPSNTAPLRRPPISPPMPISVGGDPSKDVRSIPNTSTRAGYISITADRTVQAPSKPPVSPISYHDCDELDLRPDELCYYESLLYNTADPDTCVISHHRDSTVSEHYATKASTPTAPTVYRLSVSTVSSNVRPATTILGTVDVSSRRENIRRMTFPMKR